jgi:hypothetical protein
MADESIIASKKPGFPQYSNSEKSFRTTIEYVGLQATLAPAVPENNEEWGDYPGIVASSELRPLPGTDYAELTIVTEYFFDSGDGDEAGIAQEVTYEVEWAMFQRSLFEHPEFAVGGGGTYALNAEDIAAIDAWENSPPSIKKEFYYEENNSGKPLSANARKFAEGRNLGQESWEDYAPIIRMTTRYVNGLPSTSEAGLIDNTPPNFVGAPSGYEWRKSADRAVKSGGQSKWDRVEEWTGAVKVLTDRESIFW